MQNSLTFQTTQLDVIDQNGQPWIKSRHLAAALGYKDEKSINKIYSRNQDEFTANMTQVIDISTGVNLTPTPVRIFSLRGCHLLAMFARISVAKSFRAWVLDVLENMNTTHVLNAKDTLQNNTQKALPESERESVDHRVLKNLGDFWASISNDESGQCWKKICTYFQIADISELPKELLADATKFVQDKIVTRAKKNLLAQARQEEQEAQKRIVKALPAPEFTYHQRCAAVGERMLDLRIQAARVSKEMMFVLSNPFWGLPGTISEDKRAFTDAMNYAIQSYSTSTIKSLEVVDLLFKAYVEGKKIIHQ